MPPWTFSPEYPAMQTRLVAGLGMTLLAVGLLTVFFVTYDPNQVAGPDPEPAADPTDAPVMPGSPEEVQTFLDQYNATYQALWTAAEGAKFAAESDITPGHTQARIAADRELGEFVGSAAVIAKLKLYRDRLDLTRLQDRQIEVAWQEAAHYPATRAAAVNRLIAAEAVLNDSLYAHDYILRLPDQPARRVTPNQIADLLVSSRDLSERQAVWECSKSIGPKLKDGLVELQALRNETARAMGYSSFFGLEVADYGLSSAEMITLMEDLIHGIMPLYEQLHCWVRHELAARYGVPVPPRIPAHWLGNRWAQEWPGVVDGVDLDALLADRDPKWLIEQGERFYISLGFEPLPANFWARSDLFALPADATRSKNTHASAWHVDLDRDVRGLMSVKADFSWFQTTHHELGHIYYYLAYSRPEVPPILRRGANRAFHEGVGSLIELAASQVPYLQHVELLSTDETPDEIAWLLNQALTGGVVFLPFACGTMTHWEHDLYEEDLPRHLYNTRWWDYARNYQGIDPPTPRGEDHCDPATKTHIIDDPAQYYDYALSTVILHQLHRYICREILKQDVRAANYAGSRAVGMYLDSILRLGATRDWAQVMREATGEDLSSEAMLAYFAPLQAWLAEQNAGREVGF
jgi:peptidyl-dipeptidase A